MEEKKSQQQLNCNNEASGEVHSCVYTASFWETRMQLPKECKVKDSGVALGQVK